MDSTIGGWSASAGAWIACQGDLGDDSRREILDPCLDAIFADVAGLYILDVGCGEGRYARKLAAKGAIVSGIDPVDAFIERAMSFHPDGSYHRGFAECLPFLDDSFDIVLSYLSIVDIPDYVTAIREMARVLKPGGQVVIATISNMASTTDGWFKGPSGEKLYRTVDRYMEEFKLELSWSGIEVTNYHRPLSAILRPYFESGLVMTEFYEPLPPRESKSFASEFRVPNFQVIVFRSV